MKLSLINGILAKQIGLATVFAAFYFLIFWSRPILAVEDYGFLAVSADPFGIKYVFTSPLGFNHYRPFSEGLAYQFHYFIYRALGEQGLQLVAATYASVEFALIFKLFSRFANSQKTGLILTIAWALFPWAFAKYQFFAYQNNLFWSNLGWLFIFHAFFDTGLRKTKIFAGTLLTAYSIQTGLVMPLIALFIPAGNLKERVWHFSVAAAGLLPFFYACSHLLLGRTADPETIAFFRSYYEHHHYAESMATLHPSIPRTIEYLGFFTASLLPIPKISVVHSMFLAPALPLCALFFARKQENRLKAFTIALFVCLFNTLLLISVVPTFTPRYIGMFALFPFSLLALGLRGITLRQTGILAALLCLWLPMKLPVLEGNFRKGGELRAATVEAKASMESQYDNILRKEGACIPKGEFRDVHRYSYFDDLLFSVAALELRKRGFPLETIYLRLPTCSVPVIH